MENRLFELKLDEVRAVVGGAVYYTSVNKLPAVPISAAIYQPTAPSHGLGAPAVR